MNIKIGTRGSKLAITQTKMVITAFKSVNPQINAEPVIIKTKGDLILDKSLDKIGDKGLFVAELEEQLRQGLIDMAIHSMKDLPTDDSDEFVILPVLSRADPRDVLVTKHNIISVHELPEHSVIGTGSKRRQVQIKKIIPNVQVVPIRGNVETRIRKMIEEGMDGTILAAAGLERLHIENSETYRIIPLNVEEMIPAPAQGVLACQIRKNDSELFSVVKNVMDHEAMIDTLAERTFLKGAEGGCHLPLGAFLEKEEDTMVFHYLYGDEQCENIVSDKVVIPWDKEENEADFQKKLVDTAKQCALKARAVIGR